MLSSASAQDITVSEQTFGCILDWPKVRNTRFKHSDPEKLKEAMRIFRNSVPDKEYPVGTILQLVPFEAMVKHPREKFPKTMDGSFSLWMSPTKGPRSMIEERVSSMFRKESPGLSCHQPVAKFDFVSEKGHGCAPIPFDDQKIADIQKADLRCAKK